MSSGPCRPAAIAVLDVGRTDAQLLAITSGGEILSTRQAPNTVRSGEPYPHCDTEHLWRWMMAALADLGERFAITAIVPTSYGATAALIGSGELVLPILDYEADPPARLAAEYAEVAPWFEECFCPISPAGLTLGRQLFWQSRVHADDFARARWILPFAQYWAWGLCGVPACEVTSLGAQTQLWNPRQRDFSSLVEGQGWRAKFPPLRKAWDVLGPLQFEVADKTGLPLETPVLCGIHRGGAELARCLAAGLEDFALIASGSWLVTCNPNRSLDALDPLREMVASTDLLGRPVACARFLAASESAAIAGPAAMAPATGPSAADVAALVARGTMALPSFTRSGGPFPGTGGKGRIIGPRPVTARERTALAALYIALLASVGLDLLEACAPIVIGGGCSDDPLFAALLAALRPGQPVLASTERAGSALGAALLVGWTERTAPAPLALTPVAPAPIAGLASYARAWRAAAEVAARA